jgi:hypothetical protein
MNERKKKQKKENPESIKKNKGWLRYPKKRNKKSKQKTNGISKNPKDRQKNKLTARVSSFCSVP